eukprot:357300-Chlamydomonas_euryale.AAC.1
MERRAGTRDASLRSEMSERVEEANRRAGALQVRGQLHMHIWEARSECGSEDLGVGRPISACWRSMCVAAAGPATACYGQLRPATRAAPVKPLIFPASDLAIESWHTDVPFTDVCGRICQGMPESCLDLAWILPRPTWTLPRPAWILPESCLDPAEACLDVALTCRGLPGCCLGVAKAAWISPAAQAIACAMP